MAITVVLLLVVIGSLLFHWLTPWWTTPLASNWGRMDQTLSITFVITGIFFAIIAFALVWILWRYRHRPGHTAAYEPENHRLERWLIGVTTVGIVGLLAPGLVVYADYVRPPNDAMVLEVVGEQWQWRFRFEGPDGRLGGTDARFVNPDNPFGLDPADTRGLDDVLVSGNEVHVPLNRPIHVLARSHDVLHDFYVPPFRARMNIVPGQVSSFWFTPTVAGRYESMCAQLCGVGHPNMRGIVVVEPEAAFHAWLAQQGTFTTALAAAAKAKASAVAGGPLVDQGRALAGAKGCVACHSIDGRTVVGPTWKGLFGKMESMDDGTTAKVDEEFLRGFIRNPTARSVKGYPPVMPKVELTEPELDALVAYIKAQAPQ
jgi:cytochrome c oxidase subunit 2